jgi:hypothetical protein
MKRLSITLFLAVALLAVYSPDKGGGTSTSVPVREDLQVADKGGGTSTSVPVREDLQVADKGGGTSTSVPVREDYA